MFPSSSSTSHFQVASQHSSLRRHQECAVHRCSHRCTVPAQLICHHIFHPHNSFFIRQPGEHFCSHSENTRLSHYMHRCITCLFYFTVLHKKWNRLQSPSAPPQRALLSILGFNAQLCPKWTFANSRQLLEVWVQLSKRPCCCTWEQQLFSFGSKKSWMSLWDWKTASPDWIFTL